MPIVGPRDGLFYSAHPFSSLPVEIRKKIYSHLPTIDRITAIQVFENIKGNYHRDADLLDEHAKDVLLSDVPEKHTKRYRQLKAISAFEPESSRYQDPKIQKLSEDPDFFEFACRNEYRKENPDPITLRALFFSRASLLKARYEMVALFFIREMSKEKPNVIILSVLLKSTALRKRLAMFEELFHSKDSHEVDVVKCLLDTDLSALPGGVRLMHKTHTAVRDQELSKEHPDPETLRVLVNAPRASQDDIDSAYILIRERELAKNIPDERVLEILSNSRRPSQNLIERTRESIKQAFPKFDMECKEFFTNS
jgi:hypothetical protein